jgi:hypothetical protein
MFFLWKLTMCLSAWTVRSGVPMLDLIGFPCAVRPLWGASARQAFGFAGGI